MPSSIPEGQPNVLVFFTDQQRWDTAGIYGNPLDLTPNFNAFAHAGTLFEYAFTCQPVCGPARSAIQTGLYATQNGCFRNGIPLPMALPTLATWFGNAGYDTGYIGKWHLASRDPVPVDEQGGYQYWLAANTLEFTSEPYHTVVFDREGNPQKLPGYRVDALVDAAIRFVAAPRERPFFLFVSLLEPHHQNRRDNYPAPDVYRTRYAGRWMPADLAALGGDAHQHIGGYYGMVRRLDEAFGRILDALKSLGISDNTAVVYTSDHGNHFRTRNGEYKRSVHDSSIRIPLAAGGGPFRGGGTIRQLVSLIDLAPSLLDAAGILQSGLSGRSVLPLVRRRKVFWPEEVFVQVSESQVGRAVRTERWKYGVRAADKDGWNDCSSDEYVEDMLYDLEADPHELNNLLGRRDYLPVTQNMRERLIARMLEAGESKPKIVQGGD